MPSPFPGMDPYLEDPAVWPDFHSRFADEISAALNMVLPRPYYARLDVRPEVGIVGDDGGRPIVPDVGVVRLERMPARRTPERATAAVVDRRPRSERTESFRIGLAGETLRHRYVEVRDASRGHALVTLIEIISPSNKRPGRDRRAYRKKQREILESDANLIEVDLISSGKPLVASPAAIRALESATGRGRYLVVVSRAWERSLRPDYEAFPVGLTDPLPCIGVPLREGIEEVLLDLQYVFDAAYDRGPYALGAVDYSGPPAVRLSDEEQAWVRGRVADRFAAGTEAGS